MRENIGIFRGKRIDTKQWKEGYLLGLQDKISGKDLFFIVDEMGEYHRVDPETVGEFTGLYDKDGAGLFEGDIVRYNESICTARNGVICFDDYKDSSENIPYHRGFFINWLNDPFIRKELGFWTSERNIEIVGDIHENPKLLEKTQCK